MNHYSRVWLVLFVVLALVLAGCSSAGSETAAPAPAGGAGNQQAAPTSGGDTGAAAAQSGDQVVITKDNQGKTVEMTVGQKLLVKLGEDYDWRVDVTPAFLLSQVSDAQLNKGEQGMYEAKMNGQATVQATGSPVCAKAEPACKDPNVQFNVSIKINAAP